MYGCLSQKAHEKAIKGAHPGYIANCKMLGAIKRRIVVAATCKGGLASFGERFSGTSCAVSGVTTVTH